MPQRTLFLTCAMSALLVTNASAYDCFAPVYYYPSYYYPVGVYYPVWESYSFAPVYTQPYYCPVVYPEAAPVTPIYATPQPAPPSKKKKSATKQVSRTEPPRITESRSFRKATEMMNRAIAGPQGTVQVGFWNITGRDVVLQADGQSRRVARNQAVTLRLRRSFDWQIDDESLRHVDVPSGKKTYEIVIRE